MERGREREREREIDGRVRLRGMLHEAIPG